MDLDRITNEIFPGWFNLITGREVHADMAAKRTLVCLDCPELGNGVFFDKCGKCGCPIKAKVFSPKSKCPLGKWEN